MYELMQQNIALNHLEGRVAASIYDWGEPTPAGLPQHPVLVRQDPARPRRPVDALARSRQVQHGRVRLRLAGRWFVAHGAGGTSAGSGPSRRSRPP